MNQKKVKLLKRWCRKVWDNSSERERSSFPCYQAFENKVKSDFKKIPNLPKFITKQLQDWDNLQDAS